MQNLLFARSPVGQAFETWVTLSNEALELTAAVPCAFTYVTRSVAQPNWRHINSVLGGFEAGLVHDSAKKNIDNEFETLYMLGLIGSWAALESYVETITRVKLLDNPSLILKHASAKAVRQSEARFSDLDKRQDFLLQKILRSQHQLLKRDGSGTYENQLDLIGFSESIPADISEALMEAQQVRNVWTHNSGIADHTLLFQAPNAGFELGAKAKLTRPRLGKYLLALNAYGIIIYNRLRVFEGLRPMPCFEHEKNMFKASFDALYPNAAIVKSDWVSDTSATLSDDPPQ